MKTTRKTAWALFYNGEYFCNKSNYMDELIAQAKSSFRHNWESEQEGNYYSIRKYDLADDFAYQYDIVTITKTSEGVVIE